MTSITFDGKFAIFGWCLAVACLIGMLAIIGVRVHSDPPTQSVKNRVPSLPTSSASPAPEPPKQSKEEEKPELPYYGSTVFEGEITSVYYYPQSPRNAPGGSQTHIKFNHHEEPPEEIWLCGDVRKSFEVGRRYELVITFEPNTECASNWKIQDTWKVK